MPVSNQSFRPRQLIIRYLIEKSGDQWQALSLEFGLAAQAESGIEAKRKLENMVKWYVHDALVGEDVAHADVLMARRASPSIYLRYYIALISLVLFGRHRGGPDGPATMPLPLIPVECIA